MAGFIGSSRRELSGRSDPWGSSTLHRLPWPMVGTRNGRLEYMWGSYGVVFDVIRPEVPRIEAARLHRELDLN